MCSGNDGQCQSGSSNSAGNNNNIAVAVSMKSQSVVLSDLAVATSSRSAAGGGTGRRTVVVGGFKEDTRRAEIEDVLRSLVTTWENKVDALFAPSKRGTIGFIRFGAPDNMWGFMRSRAGQPRPSYKDALLWVSV